MWVQGKLATLGTSPLLPKLVLYRLKVVSRVGLFHSCLHGELCPVVWTDSRVNAL